MAIYGSPLRYFVYVYIHKYPSPFVSLEFFYF